MDRAIEMGNGEAGDENGEQSMVRYLLMYSVTANLRRYLRTLQYASTTNTVPGLAYHRYI